MQVERLLYVRKRKDSSACGELAIMMARWRPMTPGQFQPATD